MLVALLLACPGDPAERPAPPDPVDCADDEVLDGAACVPAACGTGPWGDVEADVYVEPSTPLAEAVAAAPGARLALAAGTWDAALVLGTGHDGLTLVGRCRELVTLQGSDTPVVDLDGNAAVTLADLTIAGGRNAVEVTRGDVTLDRVDIVGAEQFGVLATGDRVHLVFDDVAVRDTTPVAGRFGRGVDLEYGATLDARGLTLAGNTDVSLFLVDDAIVTLEDTWIDDSRPLSALLGGRGVEVGLGADLVATRLRVSRASDVGVFAYGIGTSVQLVDADIGDTTATDPTTGGVGLQITNTAALTFSGGSVHDNEGAGLVADGGNSRVDVEGVAFERNRSVSEEDPGGGIAVQNGASGAVRDCTFLENTGVALGVIDAGTTLSVDRVDIADTRIGPDGHGGEALYADGGDLRADDVAVEKGQEHALYARNLATVDLTGLVVDGTFTNRDARYGRGFSVQEGTDAVCRGCALGGSHDAGVIADGPGTHLRLEDSEVSDTRIAADGRSALGLDAQDTAWIEGDGLRVTGTEGPGAYVVTDGLLTCTGCAFDDNGFAGVVVLDGTLSLTDTIVDGSQGDVSSGGGLGVYADALYGVPHVTLDGVTLTGNRYAAVWLVGDGDYTIVDSRLEGGPGVRLGAATVHGNALFAIGGVRPRDGTGGLTLAGTTLAESRTAVLLHNASGSVDDATFEENTVDVQQQACFDTVTPTGLDAAGTVVLCPDRWQLVAPLWYGLRLEDVSVDP